MSIFINEVSVGDKIKADTGFTCIAPNAIKLVRTDKDGLYVRCSHGKHRLVGQISADDTKFIGFYAIKGSVNYYNELKAT